MKLYRLKDIEIKTPFKAGLDTMKEIRDHGIELWRGITIVAYHVGQVIAHTLWLFALPIIWPIIYLLACKYNTPEIIKARNEAHKKAMDADI